MIYVVTFIAGAFFGLLSAALCVTARETEDEDERRRLDQETERAEPETPAGRELQEGRNGLHQSDIGGMGR